MPLKHLKLAKPPTSRTTHPVDLFNSASTTLRGRIENLWEPQASALKDWNTLRPEKDVVIKMNTGGGKTIVGLLIAQSVINETSGKALYVCPTKQLAEQAERFAAEAGLEAARYERGDWTNREVYVQGRGPCITNYAAVFNSRSIFRNESVSAIIFDDAHVAHNALRGQFTISLKRETNAYSQVVELFRSYFEESHKEAQLQDIVDGNPFQILYVPLFTSAQHQESLRGILEQAEVADDSLSFPLAYLREHLRTCAVILAGDRIEISPPLLPVRSLRYFEEARRVYLTATMPSSVEFIRLFGASHAKTIEPAGRLGAAQRLLIFSRGEDAAEQRKAAESLIAARKACIIVPSNRAAGEWPYPKYEGSQKDARIRKFAETANTEKLVLVARFDGVDLPGHACRLLVIDNLPAGLFLFEKFLDQGLRISRVRKANITARIVQAMGRIFRSNTDHGVVILSGPDLLEWIEDVSNQAYFPPLLQQQIQFSLRLRTAIVKEEVTEDELIEAVLNGDASWDQQYNDYVSDAPVKSLATEAEWADACALAERDGFERLWNGDYKGAVGSFADAAGLVPTGESSQYAWLRHLQGFAFFLAGNETAAIEALNDAANSRSELGRLKQPEYDSSDVQIEVPPQMETLLNRLSDIFKRAEEFQQKFTKLKYDEKETDECEDALQQLGYCLGLESYRPEKRDGTGPDVLWRDDKSRFCVGFECKTGKKPNTQYRKKEDLGQIADHQNYLLERYPQDTREVALVGRHLTVSPEANPSKDLKIISIGEFAGLASEVMSILSGVNRRGEKNDIKALAKAFKKAGMFFPDCYSNLESRLAVDLRELSQADLRLSAGE